MQYALFIYEDEALYGPDKNGPALQEILAKHMAFNRELAAPMGEERQDGNHRAHQERGKDVS